MSSLGTNNHDQYKFDCLSGLNKHKREEPHMRDLEASMEINLMDDFLGMECLQHLVMNSQ